MICIHLKTHKNNWKVETIRKELDWWYNFEHMNVGIFLSLLAFVT
jgi:hypothetical protein